MGAVVEPDRAADAATLSAAEDNVYVLRFTCFEVTRLSAPRRSL
jgi:hypothetical protein